MAKASNCAACGHERTFHRSLGFEPEPCSRYVEEGGLAGDCGCRAAFEVEAERGTLSTLAGLLAGWLAGNPKGRAMVVRHKPDEAGPPWRVVVTDSGRPVVHGEGFTLDEAVRGVLDKAEAVKRR